MSTTTTTPTVIQEIEAALEADWAKIVAFFNQEEQKLATFLTNVAQGAQILETDIQSVMQTVLGKLSTINGIISAAAGAAAAIAPGESKVIAGLVSAATGALSEVGTVATSIANGTPPSGQNAVVSDTVAVINALPTVATLAQQLSQQVSQLVQASPTATQTISPPTPNES